MGKENGNFFHKTGKTGKAVAVAIGLSTEYKNISVGKRLFYASTGIAAVIAGLGAYELGASQSVANALILPGVFEAVGALFGHTRSDGHRFQALSTTIYLAANTIINST